MLTHISANILTLASGDRLTLASGDIPLKLQLLKQTLQRLEDHSDPWSLYICSTIMGVDTEDGLSLAAQELIAYITQELVTPNFPDDFSGLSVELYIRRLGITEATGREIDRIGNMARDAWLRRMIAELEQCAP